MILPKRPKIKVQDIWDTLEADEWEVVEKQDDYDSFGDDDLTGIVVSSPSPAESVPEGRWAGRSAHHGVCARLVSGDDRPWASREVLAPATLGLRVASDDQDGGSRVM